MRLMIDDSVYHFTPLSEFCTQYKLPETFSIALFQPKDVTNLGHIDRAGADLHTVRERVLVAVPASVAAAGWLEHVMALAATFEAELRAINPTVGLREPEIAFAVSGFGDVCSAYAFALVRAHLTGAGVPPFADVYRDWLWGTVSLGGTVYPYTHNSESWTVQGVHHAYGRVGMIVTTPQGAHYVVDKALACPAEGYMAGLLGAVAARMAANTV